MKEMSKDTVSIFEIIYVIGIYYYITTKVLLNKSYYSSYNCYLTTHNSDNLFSFKKYVIRIAELYICIVLVNTKIFALKYSHGGPIHFNINNDRIPVINQTGITISISMVIHVPVV